jgi:hypothetical protein
MGPKSRLAVIFNGSFLIDPMPSSQQTQHRLLQRTNHLASLPSLSNIQPNPPLHCPRLHANHLLVPLGRPEITHILRPRPRIPHNHFIQIISHNTILLLIALSNGNWCFRAAGRSVDAVCLRGNRYGAVWRGLGRDWFDDFVDVGGRFEA